MKIGEGLEITKQKTVDPDMHKKKKKNRNKERTNCDLIEIFESD